MLLDTNILIVYLDGQEQVVGAIQAWKSRGPLFISSVSTLRTVASGGTITFTPNYTYTCSPPPTADIKANGSDGPITIAYNTAATISWSSTNASSCSVSPTGWTGTSNSGISTGNLTSSKTYSLSCTGSGGSASDSVTVNVKE